MNKAHNVLCSSGWWANRVEHELLPWGLQDIELGDDVLEVGPGFGATTKILVDRVPKLTALELNARYCERLRGGLGGRAEVVEGDATHLPFDGGRFSAVVCFTMLHHIPSAELQDAAFAEIARVLAPGGVFAGTDSIGGSRTFKLIHIGDVLNLLDPVTLPARLQTAGLTDARVERGARSLRFNARART